MQFHHYGLDQISLDASAVTIGSFDGVHQGHQVLIRRLIETAHHYSVPSVVITFFPHPIVVLRGIQDPYYLTLPDERAGILHRLGIDYIVTIPFTRDLSAKTPLEFMSMLHEHLTVRHLLIGPDFALGKDRLGNPETLRDIGKKLGYNVEIVPFKQDLSGRISSSRIRSSLAAGQIETANALLGRPYTIPVQQAASIPPTQADSSLVRVDLSCDPMQLLPAAGLYSGAFEEDANLSLTLFVRPNSGRDKPPMTVWISKGAVHLLKDSRQTCLSILARVAELPRPLAGDQQDDPILIEINKELHGG